MQPHCPCYNGDRLSSSTSNTSRNDQSFEDGDEVTWVGSNPSAADSPHESSAGHRTVQFENLSRSINKAVVEAVGQAIKVILGDEVRDELRKAADRALCDGLFGTNGIQAERQVISVYGRAKSDARAKTEP